MTKMVALARRLSLPLVLVVSACAGSHDTISERADGIVFRPIGAVVGADKQKMELVRPGMSLRQVEALVGPIIKRPCWNFRRTGAVERICFTDGLANSYIKSPLVEPDPAKKTIDGWFAGEMPPKQLPSPKSTEVTIGTSQKRVEELWGPPVSIDDNFSTRDGSYEGTFVQGRLTKFEVMPMPPVP